MARPIEQDVTTNDDVKDIADSFTEIIIRFKNTFVGLNKDGADKRLFLDISSYYITLDKSALGRHIIYKKTYKKDGLTAPCYFLMAEGDTIATSYGTNADVSGYLNQEYNLINGRAASLPDADLLELEKIPVPLEMSTVHSVQDITNLFSWMDRKENDTQGRYSVNVMASDNWGKLTQTTRIVYDSAKPQKCFWFGYCAPLLNWENIDTRYYSVYYDTTYANYDRTSKAPSVKRLPDFANMKEVFEYLANNPNEYNCRLFTVGTDYGGVPATFAAKQINDIDITFQGIMVTEDEEAAKKYIETGEIPQDVQTTGEDPRDHVTGGGGSESDGGKDDRIEKQTDDTGHSDATIFNNGVYRYVLNKTQIYHFIREFWSIDVGDALLNAITGLYDGLINSVINLRYIPFNLSDLGMTAIDVSEIVVGRTSMPVACKKINSNPSVIEVCKYTLKEKRGSYLDYAPFTSAYLYLPFAGFVHLDINAITAHELTVQFALDIATGMGQYYLFIGGGMIDSIAASVDITVPLTLSSGVEFGSEIAQTVASTITKEATAALEMNPIGAVNALEGATVDAPPLSVIGSTSPTTGLTGLLYPSLVIKRPRYNRPENYGSFYGYPCFQTKKLATIKGYTEIERPIIRKFTKEITDKEYDILMNEMKGGIVL